MDGIDVGLLVAGFVLFIATLAKIVALAFDTPEHHAARFRNQARPWR